MAQNRIELDEELLYKLKLYAIDKGLPTRNQAIVNLAMKLAVESIEQIKLSTTTVTLEEAIYKIFKSKEYSNLESNPNACGFMVAGAQEGAEWMAERMYSEEDIHNIIDSYSDWKYNGKVEETYERWFKQFKKKQNEI